MSNTSICLIDRTLSHTTSPDQSGPGIEGTLCIFQTSSITGATRSDGLKSYPRRLVAVVVGYLFTEMQSVYLLVSLDKALFYYR